MSYYLIYIPGLGDSRVSGQLRAVRTWRKYGVEAELYQMRWDDNVPWEQKFKGLLSRIDDLLAQGKQVGLVGASAGASAVINAYAARKDQIAGCLLIAGKVNRPEAIGSRYRQRNPAFIESAINCQSALRSLDESYRQRILSLYALVDESVYKPDSRIEGASNHLVPTIGHFFTIASQLILAIPRFKRFLERLPTNYSPTN